MSDRLITAEEARELLDGISPGQWELGGRMEVYACGPRDDAGFCSQSFVAGMGSHLHPDEPAGKQAHQDTLIVAAAPDLASTVIHQADQIEILSRLLSGAEGVAIERAGQIKRLQAGLREGIGVEMLDISDLIRVGIITEEDMK